METFYYHTEDEANFYDFGACLVSAVQRANHLKEDIKVYRLIKYSNGDQEHIRLATIQHGGLM